MLLSEAVWELMVVSVEIDEIDDVHVSKTDFTFGGVSSPYLYFGKVSTHLNPLACDCVCDSVSLVNCL